MDRYRINDDLKKMKYEMVRLGDVLDYEQPTEYIVESENYNDSYKTPVLTAGKSFILGYTNEVKGVFTDCLPVIIFDDFTTATKFVDFPFKVKSSAMKILKAKKEIADIKYLFHAIQKIVFNSSTHKRYWISQYSQIQIPLPPLSVQQEIVAKIENYQKIIDGAKQIITNYKPQIDIDPEWEMVELGEVCEIKSGGTPSKSIKDYWNGDIVWYSSGELNELYTSDSKEKITKLGLVNSNAQIFPKGSLLIGMYDTAAFKMSILDKEATFNQAICGIKPNIKINFIFLYLYFLMKREEYLGFRVGVRQRNLNKGFIEKIQIPLPPLEIQQEIATRIENEQKLVDSNKELIKIFEQKIKDEINKLWE